MTRGGRWQRWVPVLVTLVSVVLLGYPLALVFGLPLARRDMQDLRKWKRQEVVAVPLADSAALGAMAELSFPQAFELGVLTLDDLPLFPVAAADGRVAPPAGTDRSSWLLWADPPEPLGEDVFRLAGTTPLPDGPPGPALYDGSRLLIGGTETAAEPPDGQRTRFGFAAERGPILVDGTRLIEGFDYASDGGEVVFAVPPPFGSAVRRVTGDFAILDPAERTIALAAPPAGEFRQAAAVVRLAERLQGSADGSNRRFGLANDNVIENDRSRAIYVGGRLLSNDAERPGERVDGDRRTFSFSGQRGLISVDDVIQEEGEAFTRDGAVVTFSSPPPRNARIRQHPDYLLSDPASGTVLLSRPPPAGELVWARAYSYYAEPGCGSTLLACFFALPQHPVPFPHWIAQRVAPFVGKFALGDERNVVRATLYTTLGTTYALALGSAVGIFLAVLFVLLRPLEKALLPWVIASQTIPIIALVPVLLLVLGNFGITIQTSLLPTALIGAYIAFFPVVVGTVKGLRSVDPLSLDLMKTYAASPLQVFLMVRFPASVPYFFTSLKLGTAAALVGALVAETESNNRRGLGFQILGQVQSGNVADVWILLILSGLLGIGLVALVGLIERLAAPWRQL